MITGVVFILIIVAIEVFDKLFGDDLNPHFYRLFEHSYG